MRYVKLTGVESGADFYLDASRPPILIIRRGVGCKLRFADLPMAAVVVETPEEVMGRFGEREPRLDLVSCTFCQDEGDDCPSCGLS